MKTEFVAGWVLGESVDVNRFQQMTDHDDYVYYDGPRAYSAVDRDGKRWFFHNADVSDSAWRFVVVPFPDDVKEEFDADRLDYRTLLTQDDRYCYDWSCDEKPDQCWRLPCGVPDACLPDIWVKLNPVDRNEK